MAKCTHHYVIPQGQGQFGFCLSCKQVIEIKEEITTEELVMPPRIFEITEKLWENIKPWKLMPFHLIKENGWYISILNNEEYLIMPIQRMGQNIYFSARKLHLKTTQTSKYLYPTGVKKSIYSSRGTGEKYIITEGVADAVYCSQIYPSIALLGCYYNGSLDIELTGKEILLCLDGDSPGILASLLLVKSFKTAKSVKIVSLPIGLDPTDIPIDQLKTIILKEDTQ